MIKAHERCGGVWGRLLAICSVPLALPFDSSQGKPDCGLSNAGPGGDFLQGNQRQHPGGSYCGYPSPAVGGFWARRRLAITTKVRIAQMTTDCQGLIWVRCGGEFNSLGGPQTRCRRVCEGVLKRLYSSTTPIPPPVLSTPRCRKFDT